MCAAIDEPQKNQHLRQAIHGGLKLMIRQKRLSFVVLLLLGTMPWLVSAAALPEFTRLVKQAAPTVVNITATRPADKRQQQYSNEEEVPELFRRFFGDIPRQNNAPRPSAGSGFIISADGYILTNNHVVEGANEILVALSDRRERVATLVGSDKLSDLALLKIDARDLPKVKLGKSEKLEVGEWVVAIGSPFGFEYSVTAGIVSAKGRSCPWKLTVTMYPSYKLTWRLIPVIPAGHCLILMVKWWASILRSSLARAALWVCLLPYRSTLPWKWSSS